MAKAGLADVVSAAIPELPPPDQIGEIEKMTVADITGPSEGHAADAGAPGGGTDSTVFAAKDAAKAAAEAGSAPDGEAAAEGWKSTEAIVKTVEPDAVPSELLEFAKQLQSEWSSDPAKATASLWESMTAKEQAAFLSNITDSKGAAEEYTPFEDSDIEKALAPHMKDLTSYPAWKGEVEKAFDSHANFINDAHLRLEIANANMEAIAQVYGVEWPKADIPAMSKLVREKGYGGAVEGYRKDVAKVVEKMRQGLKDRPAGTVGTANDTPTISVSDSMAVRLQKLRAAGKL